MKFNSRLKAIQGDAYDLDENLYDAAVIFSACGYTGHTVGLHQNGKKIETSKIAYLILLDNKSSLRPGLPYYKGWQDQFTSEKEIEEYIHEMVFQTLDAVSKVGKRIAFCGIWIRYMDKRRNETMTAKAISDWLDVNPQAAVTLIDRTDCFNRHQILDSEKK